jgi:hypothetical protein
MLATSPWSFDAREGTTKKGPKLIGPVKAQLDCGKFACDCITRLNCTYRPCTAYKTSLQK